MTNFGAMKPLEQQMSFYAAYAWEAGREAALTEDEQAFLGRWIDRTFSGGYGAELAPVLTEFDQVTNARKVEQMDADAFSQTAWGDEAAGRIHRYEKMFDMVNRIWKALPEEEQDAFFQMIGMKVHAAYYTNLMYYYADRSNLCMAQGKKKAARKYTELCREFDHARRSMLYYYNHVMSNGKWNGILTPEDFPPPRTAMHPACMPPVGDLSPAEELLPLSGETPRENGNGFIDERKAAAGKGSRNMSVTLWNGGQEIVFTKPAVKWIEIGNEGDAPARYRLTGPDWIQFAETGTYETECLVDAEARILFAPDRDMVLALLKASEEQPYPFTWEGVCRAADDGERLSQLSDSIKIQDLDLSRLSGSIQILDSDGRNVRSVPVYVSFGQRGEEAAVWEESDFSEGREVSFSGTGKPGDGAMEGLQDAKFPDCCYRRESPVSIEDDGRICVEAGDGRIIGEMEAGRIYRKEEAENTCEKAAVEKGCQEADNNCHKAEAENLCEKTADSVCAEDTIENACGDKAGWKLIPNLGRDAGSLLEAWEPGARVFWQVTVLTPGSHLLELHRFPSLNSVGAIQAGVSVDQEPVQILESESNDEYRGSWKENIRNNVDKIYLRLPYMEAGTHRITFHAISRYFAFSRFVIYTGERKKDSLGRDGGDQRLPRIFDVRKAVEEYYGREAAALMPRPVLYLPENPRGGTLDGEDIMVQPLSWGKPVKAEELAGSGRRLFEEREGRLLIECGAALADTPFACMENGRWQWCTSPSHGETGLALYIREPGKRWTDPAQAPALNYRFRVRKGEYVIWIRAMMWGDDTSHFTIGLDGGLVPESALYGGRGIWRYSNEQVWKWIPVWKAQLTEGEHELRIVTFSSGLRFEQVYITSGKELPPTLG